MKRIGIFLMLCLCVCPCLLCGCRRTVEQKMQKEIMDTVVVVSVYTNKGKEPLRDAFERAEELEHMLSVHEENSEISKLNERGYREEVVVSPELFYLVERGVYYGTLTDGAIDITLGKLIDLWGIGTGKEQVPKQEDILPYVGMRGYEKIILNEEKSSIRFSDPNIKINLGAIAKGYIADEMKKILVEKYKITSGMLSLGGNILLIGKKRDGSQWKVGIADPLSPDRVTASLNLEGLTLVTSGNYQRFFEHNGVYYHHIIDPYTGVPAENGVISASILTDCSMAADALSTATYVMGKEKAMVLLEKLDGFEGVFVLTDGSISKTSGVASYTYQEY